MQAVIICGGKGLRLKSITKNKPKALAKFNKIENLLTKSGVELLLNCQRCLEPVNIVIKKLSTLGLYRNLEEFSKLENNYEPLQLNEELISLELLVEDEILLAAPLAPRHSNKDCIKERIAEKISVKNRENPFSVLKKLKNDKV